MDEIIFKALKKYYAGMAFVFSVITLLCFATGSWNASIAASLLAILGMYANKHIDRNKPKEEE